LDTTSLEILPLLHISTQIPDGYTLLFTTKQQYQEDRFYPFRWCLEKHRIGFKKI